MVSVFPSTVAHFVRQQQGAQVETMGNALEVKLCKPILNTALSPKDGSSPLVTTTFQLNLQKYDLLLENIRIL